MDEPTAAVKTLGRYQLHGELGRGAMGVVYRAFDPVIGRTVALKTLTVEGKDQEAETLRQRLYREACAAGTLAHPNIVTIYDVIEQGETTAVAMECIEGQTLADLIEAQAPMPLDAALDVFEQVCAAIDYAGSQGIVHRDIKPANIMVTTDGRVKVADFGVARIEASTMTQTGMVMGSPSYMSPEQVRGQSLDARSDLFSAAVVLYELLTKQRPFAGDDVATTMYRIVHEPPVPPSQFNVAIGEGISAILHRALAKTPDERYRTGAELCGQLRRSLGGMDLPVLPSLPMERGAAPRFSPLVLGAAGLGAVLLLVLVVVALSGRTEEAEAPVRETAAVSAPPAAAPDPVPPMVVAAPEPPVAEAPVSMPVSTIPPRSGGGTTGSSPPSVAPEAAASSPVPAPAVEPAAPAIPPATLTVAYAGAAYAVAISAGGERLGIVSGNGGSVSVEPGTHRIRASSSAVFLSEDLGNMTLESGAERTVRMPALASAFVGVLGDAYDGLQITISGTRVDGPYPAQVAKIAVGRHAVVFTWTSGGLSGLEIKDVVDVSSPGHYLIRAVPQMSQVTVQKLR